MKIIIDIPEDVKIAFDNAESNDLKGCYYDHGGVIGNAIKNGTPLPEGHGRLGDIDWVLHKMDITDAQPVTPNEHYAWDFCKEILNNIPTIIEADKEVQHDD